MARGEYIGTSVDIKKGVIGYEGVTTANGAADGSTLIDTNLTTDFIGAQVVVTEGLATFKGQSADITVDTSTGTIHAHHTFGAQIPAGTPYKIVTTRAPVPASETENVAKEGWTTYYVDGTNGDDTWDGLSWGSAKATIQEAVDTSDNWGKIYIAAGTYVENVVIDKNNIKVIGVSRDTVIISPATGMPLHVNANFCTIAQLTAKVNDDGETGILLTGSRNVVADIVTDTSLVGALETAYGVIADGNENIIKHIRSTTANKMIAIGVSDGDHNTICKCFIENAIWGIVAVQGEYNLFYDNFIKNCSVYGVYFSVESHDSVFHNNLIGNATQIYRELGANNEFFENFYDDHTTDTNNDGLCDSTYTFTTGTDYTPVSKLNGWEQISLGSNTSSAITVGNIFSLVNGILVLTETGSTITTTGAVQTVYINNAPAGAFEPRSMLIDFTAHLAADTIVLRTYYRLKSGGGLIKADEETITGVQDPALKIVEFIPNRFGYQVTMEKTAGANHDYDWEVLYKI